MTATQPTPEQAAAFAARDPGAPVVMVNLLKFKAKATYAPDAPEAGEGLSGQEAYGRYGMAVAKILDSIGATRVYAGALPHMMIGEGDYDAVALVRYPSRASMIAMTMSPEYQAIHYHREAGLDHQVLIETTELPR